MSWPPSPQYPSPGPEQPHGGYPGQSGQPYPGYQQPQPGYGQPDPYGHGSAGYPTSSPGYGQPPTSPPNYGQPQGGYPGYAPEPTPFYPGYPPPPAPKKSKAGMITAIVLAVVLVVCGGGGFAAYRLLKDPVGETVQASKTSVVEPESLAGRAKLDMPELQSVADEMVNSLRADIPGVRDVVSAFYGDPTKKDMIMMLAMSGSFTKPAKEMDEAIAAVKSSALEVTGVKSVDPGPLGGEARCADASTEGISLGVCFWADRGCVGMIGMYWKTGAEAAAEFVQIRGQIEIVK